MIKVGWESAGVWSDAEYAEWLLASQRGGWAERRCCRSE
jgi:hypothetical protein